MPIIVAYLPVIVTCWADWYEDAKEVDTTSTSISCQTIQETEVELEMELDTTAAHKWTAMCNRCAADLRQMCNRCATDVRQMYGRCATDVRGEA